MFLTIKVHAQEELDLSGPWQFSIDSQLESDKSWIEPDFNSATWKTLTVPGNWDTENEYAHFSGTGYYIKCFEFPENWNGSYVRLHFGAVYQKAKVWFNGTCLGEHVGGYTPFDFDVTDLVLPGDKNILAVSVNNKYNRGAWWKWGGISQKVFLVKEGKLRIVRHQIVAMPDLKNGTSQIDAHVFVQNNSDTQVAGYLNTQVFDRDEKKAFGDAVKKHFSIEAKAVKSIRIRIKLNATQTKLWDIDHPNLYRLTSKIDVKEHLIAQASDRFGIRKIETKNAKLLLNGKPLHLNGFNRIATHRAYGQIDPAHLIKFDIDTMMAMGAGLTRIAHHAQNPALLDYCDEVGMLLIEEIPVWGKTDRQVKPNNPLTKQWLTEMIERDFNHPCIIGWSVGNELAERNLSRQRMSWKVYEYVRTMLEYVEKLDPTRLKTYVSNTATEANGPGVDPNDLCDILCHNSYGGSSDQVEKLHRIWPDKPVFVTELGKSQLGEHLDDSKLDDRLRKEIVALKEFDFVIGCSIWSYNDYRSHFRGTPLSENRAWGVYNVWRQPKAGAYGIRELFTGKVSKESLPTMVGIPDRQPKDQVYIQAVVPMKNSCMVGFTVVDKKDSYEIVYQRSDEFETVINVENLRGAVKIENLQPGQYTFRIRKISSGQKGKWSATYPVIIN